MTTTTTETRSVVVEREIPHPPEKIWRALTQSHLMEEWLMKNDFQPRLGHKFNFRAEPQGLAPLIDWMGHYAALWRDRFDRLEDLLNRMDQ